MYIEEMYHVYFDFKLEIWVLATDISMLNNNLDNTASNVKFSHINWSVESMESTLLVMYL